MSLNKEFKPESGQ